MRHTDNDGISEYRSGGQRSGVVEYSISCCQNPELVSMEMERVGSYPAKYSLPRVGYLHQDYSIKDYVRTT